MNATDRVPVALDEALHWDLQRLIDDPGRSMPDTQREALDNAVAVWLEIDDPDAVLGASETLRGALDTRRRVRHPELHERLEGAYRELVESSREQPGGQSPRPEEGAGHKPVHVSRPTHRRLSEAAESRSRSRKECLGEAVRLWMELKHWEETQGAREVLDQIRALVHPPKRSGREAASDDD